MPVMKSTKPAITKPAHDIPQEVYEIMSRLTIQAELQSQAPGSDQPPRLLQRAYVEWSEDEADLQPLHQAIEELAERVRDTVLAGKPVFTRADLKQGEVVYEQQSEGYTVEVDASDIPEA